MSDKIGFAGLLMLCFGGIAVSIVAVIEILRLILNEQLGLALFFILISIVGLAMLIAGIKLKEKGVC